MFTERSEPLNKIIEWLLCISKDTEWKIGALSNKRRSKKILW